MKGVKEGCYSILTLGYFTEEDAQSALKQIYKMI